MVLMWSGEPLLGLFVFQHRDTTVSCVWFLVSLNTRRSFTTKQKAYVGAFGQEPNTNDKLSEINETTQSKLFSRLRFQPRAINHGIPCIHPTISFADFRSKKLSTTYWFISGFKAELNDQHNENAIKFLLVGTEGIIYKALK